VRNNSKSGIERQLKKTKSPENTPKHAKKQSTETKRIVPKYKLDRGPVFTSSCLGGGSHPCHPLSYATDQVHFKHEQPQVLLIESHVIISTIQQTQDAAGVL